MGCFWKNKTKKQIQSLIETVMFGFEVQGGEAEMTQLIKIVSTPDLDGGYS